MGITSGDTVSADSSTDIITIIGTKSYEVQATSTARRSPRSRSASPPRSRWTASTAPSTAPCRRSARCSRATRATTTRSSWRCPSSAAAACSPGRPPTSNISTGRGVQRRRRADLGRADARARAPTCSSCPRANSPEGRSRSAWWATPTPRCSRASRPGQSVVLADYAEAVPSSNTDTDTCGGRGGFLGGGGAGGGFFGGAGGGLLRPRRRRLQSSVLSGPRRRGRPRRRSCASAPPPRPLLVPSRDGADAVTRPRRPGRPRALPRCSSRTRSAYRAVVDRPRGRCARRAPPKSRAS